MSRVVSISGAGGGGSDGGGTESSNTIKSKSYAQLVDLICEGEIGGLVNGAKSVYLDDVPLQNADGSYNFTGFSYFTRNGTQDQPAIDGAASVQNEVGVAVEVTKDTGPIIRNITNADVDTVLVTIQIPALTDVNDDGEIIGTRVQYTIDVNINGGGWVTAVNEDLNGKSSTSYERQYRIPLAAGTTRSIRVNRITNDSEKVTLNNKTVWKSYTEVISATMRYPNSAIVATTIEAAQFQSIPRRGYDVKLLKIRIPTNATVDESTGRLIYSGTWDGTFKIAWCACPAWAFYDMLTTDRYGLGTYIDAAQVDKWSLYTISKYCNELVSDGFGGQEARFACNTWISSRQEAFTLLNQMTSIFRGMSYWGSGTVTAIQDAPKDPTYLFTNSNVKNGVFTYQGSSAKQRHTVALVTWNDPQDMYRQKVEYVEDTDAIARYGIIETEVVAVGCTSRGQANRVGRWLLYTEKYETEAVVFRTGIEGTSVLPGDVIKIADQHRAGARIGGRVSSATVNSVTVDSLASVPSGTLTLYVMSADGSVHTRTVQEVDGNTIYVLENFTSIPQAQSGWILSSSSIEAQTYRVISVAETEGEFEVSAMLHNPSKYGFIEDNLTLETRDVTNLSPVPDAVSSISLTENLYTYQSSVLSKIIVSWPAALNASRYKLEWRVDEGSWTTVETSTQDYDILNTRPGLYEVRLTSIGVFGTTSSAATTASINALGKTAPPADVTGFTYTIDSKIGVTLRWSNVPDLDLQYYEIRQGADWANGTIVTRVAANTHTLGAISGASQTFWIKAVDTSGGYSANPASLITSFSAPTPVTMSAQVVDNNVLLRWTVASSTLAVDYYEIRRGSTWASGTVVGRVSNSTFTTLFETQSGAYTYWIAAVDIGGNVGAISNVSATVAQPPDYQLFTNYNSTLNGTLSNAVLEGGVVYLAVNSTETWESHFTSRGWTTIQNQIDAGYPYFIEPTGTSGYYEEIFDYGGSLPATKVTITPTNVTILGSSTVTPNLQVSNDGTSWTDFGAVTEAFATNFRYVKFRLTVSSSGGDDIVALDGLNFRLDAKQKADSGMVTAVSTDAGGTTVNFNAQFVDVSSITVSPQGTSALRAVYDFTDTPNPTGFKVLLFDSAGNRASGTVSWTARGY